MSRDRQELSSRPLLRKRIRRPALARPLPALSPAWVCGAERRMLWGAQTLAHLGCARNRRLRPTSERYNGRQAWP
jgi:hypothetical protein